MRPSYPKAEEHGIEGEVETATLPEILDLIEIKSASIQGPLTSACFGHLTLAISMLHKQQRLDREQLEDLRSRFNKEAVVETDDIDPLTCDPVNGHLAGGMTAEEVRNHDLMQMQKMQDEHERQLADKDREIAQLKNRLEQIQRVTEDVDF